MNYVMPACKRFKGRHTAENILHGYEDCITSYDINDNICCVISDNASNMVKAFSFPVSGYTDSDEQFWLNNDTIEDYCDPEESESQNPFPKHKRCYAHSLLLVIKDAFEECGQTIQKVIANVSKVVSHVRKSVCASEVLEDENRHQVCNATRWISQMHMIRSILNSPDDKFEKPECASITAYDKKVLCEICTILKPFEYATLLVQREKNVSGSMVIPVTLGLKKHYFTKFVSALLASLSKRLCKYEEDDVYTTSSILDTRFKLLRSKPEDVNDLTTDLKKRSFLLLNLSNQRMMKLTAYPLPRKRSKLMTFLVFFQEVLLSENVTCQDQHSVLTLTLEKSVTHLMPILFCIGKKMKNNFQYWQN